MKQRLSQLKFISAICAIVGTASLIFHASTTSIVLGALNLICAAIGFVVICKEGKK